MSLKKTICDISRNHIVNGGVILAQNVTSVGWIQGTVPSDVENNSGIIELPTCDLGNCGVACGFALAGKRPIEIIRYQGFAQYCIQLVNYACKSKEIWGIPCPIFFRAIAMEGSIGPVAGSSHHSLFYRMPGVKIFSPMTPMEYETCYNEFMKDDDVYYISEHRGSYNQENSLSNIDYDRPDFVLFPISITRFAAIEASRVLSNQGLRVSVFHQFRLKPYVCDNRAYRSIKSIWCAGGLVLDDDYPDGIASAIANKISVNSGRVVYTMGLEERSAGFAPHLDNLPPTIDKIVHFVKERINEQCRM